MKKVLLITFALALGVLLAGCSEEEPADMASTNGGTPAGGIAAEEIADFYYTAENINFDAFYQRYRFYVEDGRHMFFHERREREGQYGPATEADTTLTGTAELSDAQWEQFCGFVTGGSAAEPQESVESGGSGPWMFIYMKADASKQLQFSFDSYATQTAFEEFCAALAQEYAD